MEFPKTMIKGTIAKTSSFCWCPAVVAPAGASPDVCDCLVMEHPPLCLRRSSLTLPQVALRMWTKLRRHLQVLAE